MSYSLTELERDVQTAAGAFGRVGRLPVEHPDRVAVQHNLMVAKLAHQVAKTIDAAGVGFTEEDAERICSVLTSRVGGAR
ncbi:hypothetical protein ACIRN4_23920 [Pimelobacter simplex]|uniref:hypothetical protein n=1 Tax=Nocardioides simplex TaxID=2045 RepID=UPI0038166966